MELQIVGKHEFVLKLNGINRIVRVSILESFMYKSKESGHFRFEIISNGTRECEWYFYFVRG